MFTDLKVSFTWWLGAVVQGTSVNWLSYIVERRGVDNYQFGFSLLEKEWWTISMNVIKVYLFKPLVFLIIGIWWNLHGHPLRRLAKSGCSPPPPHKREKIGGPPPPPMNGKIWVPLLKASNPPHPSLSNAFWIVPI